MPTIKRRQLPEKLVSVGCDYLMATTKHLDTADKWQNAWMLYARGLGKSASLNTKEGRWRGYYTKELPGMMVGTRRDGAIVRLTGETANIMYQMFEPMVSKVTRLDLQCTYDFSSPYPELAQLYREVLIESGYKRTKKPAILGDDGQTLYLGSMSSPQFGRIYDRAKTEKLDVLGKRWRYEVVWRNEKAQRVLRTLRQKVKWQDKLDAMYSIVSQWFVNHWCDMPVGAPPQEINLVEVGAKIKTIDTQIEWLRTGVRPAVQRLIEAGASPDVILHALGLSSLEQYVQLQNDLDTKYNGMVQ